MIISHTTSVLCGSGRGSQAVSMLRTLQKPTIDRYRQWLEMSRVSALCLTEFVQRRNYMKQPMFGHKKGFLHIESIESIEILVAGSDSGKHWTKYHLRLRASGLLSFDMLRQVTMWLSWKRCAPYCCVMSFPRWRIQVDTCTAEFKTLSYIH